MGSKHKFSLPKDATVKDCPAGSRILASSLTIPHLHGLAMATITLKKNGIREPHWHPNAAELTYCLFGRVLITLFGPGNDLETFTLDAGEVVYIPMGVIHHLENIYDGETQLVLGYDHDAPEDLDLSFSVASMPAHAVAKTLSVTEAQLADSLRDETDVFISQGKGSKTDYPSIPNRFKFSLETINPQIESSGGLARIVNGANLPVLEHIALFSLRLAVKGIREPHWHPNAIELNYVVEGKAALVVVSPSGDIDRFTLEVGEGSIIPAGYIHYIENIGPNELHMTIYFSNRIPNDIGISGTFGAYSDEVLASVFKSSATDFSKWPKIHVDRMVVAGGA